jgi:hypothetical protein
MNRFPPILFFSASLAGLAGTVQAAECQSVTITMAKPEADLRLLNKCDGKAEKFAIKPPKGAACFKSKSNVAAYLNDDPSKKVNLKTVSAVLETVTINGSVFPVRFTTTFHVSGKLRGNFSTEDIITGANTESLFVLSGTGTKDFSQVSGGGGDEFVALSNGNIVISKLKLDLCL